jgi:hypothetical protein
VTSATTNPERARDPVVTARPLARRISASRPRPAWMPGSRPKNRPAPMVTAAVPASTRPSTLISSARGNGKLAGNSDTIAGTPACAQARTFISRARALARMPSRQAMLAHAISRTQTTTAISTHSARRTEPTAWSRSRTTVAPPFALKAGSSCASCVASADISACARSSGTPGRSRATVTKLRPPRPAGSLWSGSSENSSALMPGNEKPGGITPSTSRGAPLTSICRPITLGCPP